jgi:hypothetical protein
MEGARCVATIFGSSSEEAEGGVWSGWRREWILHVNGRSSSRSGRVLRAAIVLQIELGRLVQAFLQRQVANSIYEQFACLKAQERLR